MARFLLRPFITTRIVKTYTISTTIAPHEIFDFRWIESSSHKHKYVHWTNNYDTCITNLKDSNCVPRSLNLILRVLTTKTLPWKKVNHIIIWSHPRLSYLTITTPHDPFHLTLMSRTPANYRVAKSVFVPPAKRHEHACCIDGIKRRRRRPWRRRPAMLLLLPWLAP